MSHRVLNSRLEELLDGIRQEFDNVRNEASTYRLHRDENDHKFNQQTSELSKIKSTVYELEHTHRSMKEAYENDIAILKQQLEQKDRQLAAQLRESGAAYGKPFGYQPAGAGNGQTEAAHAAHVTATPPMAAARQTASAVAAPVAAPVTTMAASAPPPAHVAVAAAGAAAPQSHVTAVPPNAASSAGPGAPAVVSQQSPPQTVVKREQPDAARAAHSKVVPEFLRDLDASSVPPELKKQMQDYYVLYNPQVPRKLDVEMVHSFDHASVVCCVRFSNDGKYLATGCNKTTQVYNVETGELMARLLDSSVNSGGPGAPEAAGSGDLYIRSVCFSPDGKFLATGAEDKLIRIWDLSTRRITKYLKGHEQDIYSLDFFPDGRKLISGSGDRTVRIWDLTSGLTQLTLTIEDGVTTVAVSQDGKWIAAGSLDRIVRVWDAVTGFLIERLDSENENDNGHKDSVYSVIFTNNGTEIASGSLDTTVKLWSLNGLSAPAGADKPPTRCEVTYVGHKDFVLSVCATPDGKYILSGSKDRGVIFWDKVSGTPLLMLQGHRNSVISVSVANHPISGNGMFATGSGDCKARIWKWRGY